MLPCGNCRGGVVQGAVCTDCKGTTFIAEPKVEVKAETTVEKVKRAVKKVVSQ